MNKIILKISSFIVTALALPIFAYAHAVPITYVPDSSATVDLAPKEITIELSERLESGASQISVIGPSGKIVSQGKARVDQNNLYRMSVPLSDDGNGTYIVSWNVISSDDGHFTKGSYVFAVGKGVVISNTGAQDTEVVQIANTPEVVGMTLEFLGNGLMWAILILFALIFRSVKSFGRIYKLVFINGISIAIIGAVIEIIAKVQSLAFVQAVSFSNALPTYLQTVAGEATLSRIVILFIALAIFVIFRKKILDSEKFTRYEWCLVILMLVFAYFRAKVSHATANPFYPDFSVFINLVHLIVKDMWAGIAITSLVIILSKNFRSFLIKSLSKIFAIQAYIFGAVSITACYIIWLHLKDFHNLFTTEWGGIFLQLSVSAILLVVIRLYHVFARIFKSDLFLKSLPMTFAIEAVMAVLVIYCSSAVLITSPPLTVPHTQSFYANDQGVNIKLERDMYEDGMVLLTTSLNKTPILTIEDEANTIGPLTIDVSKRFDGGYVFPISFLSGAGPFKVSVTVPQDSGYDAQAVFEVKSSDFTPRTNGPVRSFDVFTIVMLVGLISSIVFAFVVYKYSAFNQNNEIPYRTPEFSAVIGFLSAILIGGYLISLVNSSSWSNPYKALCISDGNMWHLMLPSKAGKPVSNTSREGCMWGMGDYMYMFPDMREYSYYMAMDKAEATLDRVGSNLTVSLKEKDGKPATLFVDMERLVHMVIVSADQTVFAHIHGTEISPSTFKFTYDFPKAGKYLVSVDYAHGLQLEAKQFSIDVVHGVAQEKEIATYKSPANFGDYTVSVDFGQPYVGEVETFKYSIRKNGKPVTNLEPYLSAPMHISVVKNDLSEFIHTHGEIHPPNTPYPPIIVKNGRVVHSMAMMVLPKVLGPDVEAHLIFPSAGIYTVWGEFKADGKVIPTSFTVRVE